MAFPLLELFQAVEDLGGTFPIIGPKIPPAITLSGRIAIGNGSAVDAFLANQMFQFTDSVTWTRSGHGVKAGFELLKLRYLNRSFFLSMGTYTFSGTFTGNPAADFLIGRPERHIQHTRARVIAEFPLKAAPVASNCRRRRARPKSRGKRGQSRHGRKLIQAHRRGPESVRFSRIPRADTEGYGRCAYHRFKH